MKKKKRNAKKKYMYKKKKKKGKTKQKQKKKKNKEQPFEPQLHVCTFGVLIKPRLAKSSGGVEISQKNWHVVINEH